MGTFCFLGTTEIVVIVMVILLLFGGRKIPELMRGVGRGVRSFKEGMNGVEEEMKKPVEKNSVKDEPTEKKDE